MQVDLSRLKSVPVRNTSGMIFTHIHRQRGRERMSETDRDGMREKSLTDFSDNVPYSLFLGAFYPVPLVEYTHESEEGIACSQNGEWHFYRYKTTVT